MRGRRTEGGEPCGTRRTWAHDNTTDLWNYIPGRLRQREKLSYAFPDWSWPERLPPVCKPRWLGIKGVE